MLRTSFLSNTRPFYAPDLEGGGGDVGGDVGDVSNVGDSDTGDTGEGGTEPEGDQGQGEAQKPLSVRDEIKRAMQESSGEQPEQPKPKGKSRKAAASKEAAPDGAPPAEAPKSTVPAPARLSQEAKVDWDKAPESIKNAFVKAEQDMQRGVDELKQKYSLIDQALAPHQDAMKQMNATPGEAVHRMFLWFKALAENPVQSYIGLSQAMGHDWNKIVAATQRMQGGQQQPQGQQQTQEQQQPEVIPEPVRNYVGQLENQVRQLTDQVQQVTQGFTGMRQDVEQQNYLKTKDNLGIWSQGKEYYEEVRMDMAQLLQAGMVPLLPNGQVDLDKAYETAIYMNPTVRDKVLAKQQQANQQVQSQAQQAQTTANASQVAKARKAAVSLPANAPGVANATARGAAPKKGQSIRDSLKQAISELRENQ